jgi:chemotaxis protein histidine kinase CheA
MSVDAFADRLARVRHRFVSSLQSKIDDAFTSTAKLADLAPGAVAAVGETYRCMHGIVGVGPTVGFPVTGRAAHDVEELLRPAQQEGRGLRPDEILILKKRLIVLREAAARELRFFYSATA